MADVTRFVAFDVHKHSVMVTALNPQQQVLLSPRRVTMERFPEWIQSNITANDAVVLEATTNAWTLYDL